MQNADQNHSAYIGDIINGLAKEAAIWKARCSTIEVETSKLKAENDQLRSQLLCATGKPAQSYDAGSGAADPDLAASISGQ